MNTNIGIFESKTGWTTNLPAFVTFPTENKITQFVAGRENTQSLMIKFAAGSMSAVGGPAYAEITLGSAVDLSLLEELVFHIWSRNKKSQGTAHRKVSDFAYKITLTGSTAALTYLLPTYGWFNDLTFDIVELADLVSVRIEPLHDDEDYLILSHMVAVTEEVERDIMEFTRQHLQEYVDAKYRHIVNGVDNKGVRLGTVTAGAGDEAIQITPIDPDFDVEWVERYAVIKIDDGVNVETHQVDALDDNGIIKFGSLFDGEAIVNAFTNADVFLILPVDYGQQEKEILLPGITLWGFAPESLLRSNKEDQVRDSMKEDGTVRARTEMHNYLFQVLIDCEARHPKLLQYMSRRVRDFLAGESMYINGRRYDIDFGGPSSFTEQVEATNEIPKVQWTMNIEVYEDAFDRETLVPITLTNLDFTATLNPGGF